MFKKVELWVVLLVCIVFFISAIMYGSLLVYHYNDGKRFEKLQKVAVFLAKIPINLKSVISKDRPPQLIKHKNKPKFKRFINSQRNELLILPRYDGNKSRSVVEIIDLNNFEILHTYEHDITSMNNLIDTTKREHKRIKIDNSEIRFRYWNPLITKNLDMISTGSKVIFKTDFCSKLLWINQDELFHHSLNLDIDGNIWVGSQMFPYSNLVKKYMKTYGFAEDFADDAIAKINQNGKIIFTKSITELLIELDINGLEIMYAGNDPIHLNDIEPAFFDTDYWKKDDLFISIRNQNRIIHYRPSTNEIINKFDGGWDGVFYRQHDVDIVSDKEISIFNNSKTNNSEVIIYNFETKKFSKKFNDKLIENNFKTETEGLSEILKDGSMLVEEQEHGRLIFFNNEGQKEWEYINKDNKGNIYLISWSRIIDNQNIINKIKEKIKNTKCQS